MLELPFGGENITNLAYKFANVFGRVSKSKVSPPSVHVGDTWLDGEGVLHCSSNLTENFSSEGEVAAIV